MQDCRSVAQLRGSPCRVLWCRGIHCRQTEILEAINVWFVLVYHVRNDLGAVIVQLRCERTSDRAGTQRAKNATI